MKKQLRELIEMAKINTDFTARIEGGFYYTGRSFLSKNMRWSIDEITADWIVKIKRNPRVIWATYIEPIETYKIWGSKEQAEPFGTPIKFIEVMEEEKGE